MLLLLILSLLLLLLMLQVVAVPRRGIWGTAVALTKQDSDALTCVLPLLLL
jgi:hypothetical protein